MLSMQKIIKIPNKTFNDGYINFGSYEVIKDNLGNEIDKQFKVIGDIAYNFETIREIDKLKYETNKVAIDLKISVNYNPTLSAFHIIEINNTLYSINYLDHDNLKNCIYLYLTELKDTLKTKIKIFRKITKSMFEKENLQLLQTVYANVKKTELANEKTADKTEFINKYTIILRENHILENAENNGALDSIIIGLENKRLMIYHINTENLENGLYELKVEEV